MEILYLGTAACEGIPSMYCKCPVCTYARKHKGKELRTRSSVVIDNKLFIDFSADTYANTVKHNIVFGEIEHLFVTHSDADHFYPEDLAERYLNGNYTDLPQKLKIYGNETVIEKFRSVSFFSESVLEFTEPTVLKRNVPVAVGEYTVTPFYTEHLPNEECFVYLIEKSGKAYLHLVDSSFPQQFLFDYLKDRKVKLDCVSMDCTFGSVTQEYGGHMNLGQNVKVKEKLVKYGIADETTVFVSTHISHFGGVDTYASLSKKADDHGITLAYDGMKLNF